MEKFNCDFCILWNIILLLKIFNEMGKCSCHNVRSKEKGHKITYIIWFLFCKKKKTDPYICKNNPKLIKIKIIMCMQRQEKWWNNTLKFLTKVTSVHVETRKRIGNKYIKIKSKVIVIYFCTFVCFPLFL